MLKTIAPDQPGARRWHDQFGDQLVCVRYREVSQPPQQQQQQHDPHRHDDHHSRDRHLVTVELVIAETGRRSTPRPRPQTSCQTLVGEPGSPPVPPAPSPIETPQTPGPAPAAAIPTSATPTAKAADQPKNWVVVRIESHEEELRHRAYATGATCDPFQPHWRMPLATARALALTSRIVPPQP